MAKGFPTILITGGSGYIGRNLIKKSTEKFYASWTYFRNKVGGITSQSFLLDMRNSESVRSLIYRIKPSLIYHLAYDRNELYESIVIGTRNILNACKGMNIKVFFLSTDSVFDGKRSWYKEEDTPQPIFDYGRIKYEAEKIVLEYGGLVIRTSLVYGLKPIDPRTDELLSGLKTSHFLYGYFTDEYRCPIFVDDLCESLLELPHMNTPRILHIAGSERINRYDFSVRLAKCFGFDGRTIPAGSLEGSGMIRPKDVSLQTSLAKKLLKTRLRSSVEVLEGKIYPF